MNNYTLMDIVFNNLFGSHAHNSIDGIVSAVIQSPSLERIQAVMMPVDDCTSNMLFLNTNIVDFNCSHGWIRGPVNVLSQALAFNTSLCWLDIHNVRVSDQERLDITRATHSHLALQSLNMSIEQPTALLPQDYLTVLADRPVVLSKLELPARYYGIAYQRECIEIWQASNVFPRYSSVLNVY